MVGEVARPIQVFLDTQRLIQAQASRKHGPHRDFFAGDNPGFERHKAKIIRDLTDVRQSLLEDGDPAGFVMVQMREEALGKSYRPLGVLFTVQNRFALVGGAKIGQMYFQATPEALEALGEIIQQKAEIQPRLVEDEDSGEIFERVSAHRSEVGAIEEIKLPIPADRVNFSAKDAVA